MSLMLFACIDRYFDKVTINLSSDWSLYQCNLTTMHYQQNLVLENMKNLMLTKQLKILLFLRHSNLHRYQIRSVCFVYLFVTNGLCYVQIFLIQSAAILNFCVLTVKRLTDNFLQICNNSHILGLLWRNTQSDLYLSSNKLVIIFRFLLSRKGKNRGFELLKNILLSPISVND